MLGVFKKKLKPKRQSRRNKGSNIQAITPTPSDFPPTENGAGSSKKSLELEDIGTKSNHDTISDNTCYPLSPNICVEGGRIEFIKIPQSDIHSGNFDEKIKNLEQLLVEEKLKNEKEKIALSKLQRHNVKLESQLKTLEQEKAQTDELYLKNEEQMKATLAMLQGDCRRLEEGVRSLLPYKSLSEQLKNEKLSISLAYEGKLQQYHRNVSSLLGENESLKQKLRSLESKEAGYEACLDQVASQVVKALLSQKALKEEIGSLRARIRDLEQQNLSLTSLICCQHQAKTTAETPSAKIQSEAFPGTRCRPHSLNLNSKVPEVLVGSSCQKPDLNPSDTAAISAEMTSIKFSQFAAHLNNLVSAKICDHMNHHSPQQVSNMKTSGESRVVPDVENLNDIPKMKAENNTASFRSSAVSCEPSAPDLSCLSPVKRRSSNTTKPLVSGGQKISCGIASTSTHSELCRLTDIPETQKSPGSKFTECNFNEMSDSDLARISFCEIPAKDEGYNTLTSEIIPDFETSLNTDITRLLPDLAEESEASFEFSKLQPLRHSYPPLNTKIKFQHLLNYFSDSQLFLRFPDLNPGSVIRFSDFWDYEPGFELESSHSNFEFGGSESLWNIEELLKSERPLSLTPSSSSDSDHSNSLSDGNNENSSNVEFTNDYYCLVKVGSVKSLASTPQVPSETGLVLCEFSQAGKLLPQESLPLLLDTDDLSISNTLEISEYQDQEEQTTLETNFGEESQTLSLSNIDSLDEQCDQLTETHSNDTSSKSSSDMELFPGELEFCTVTKLKKSPDHQFNEIQHRNLSSSLPPKRRSKSETHINSQKTLIKKRPNSECFLKSQGIHKSYYNNFVKFLPKKSCTTEDSGESCTMPNVQVNCMVQSDSKDNLNFDSGSKSSCLLPESPECEKLDPKELLTTINPSDELKEPSGVKLESEESNFIDFESLKGDVNFTSDSKKIIETLNRMIQKSSNSSEERLNRNSIEYKEGIPTSWVHFEKQTNFSDPKERANLLDKMVSAVPSSEESEDDAFKDYQHLLRLHRRRRHRKAYMHHGGFVRNAASGSRASIVGQRSLYTRYGEAEKQAVASFDFLFENDNDYEEDNN